MDPRWWRLTSTLSSVVRWRRATRAHLLLLLAVMAAGAPLPAWREFSLTSSVCILTWNFLSLAMR